MLKNILLVVYVVFFSVKSIAQDINPPIAICNDITIYIEQEGLPINLSPQSIDAGSYDDEGSITLSISPSTLDCSNIGSNNITLTVTDQNGNIGTCNATVSVVDSLPPIAIDCPFGMAITMHPDTLEDTTYPVDDYSQEALNYFTDNCTNPLIFVSQSPEAGTMLPTGNYNLITTVQDSSGNIAACTQLLVIEILQLSLEEYLKENPIKIYPNPTEDFINITLSSSIFSIKHINFIDITGKMIRKYTSLNNFENHLINLNEFEAGIYFLDIYIDNIKITKRIVKSN